MGREGRQTVGPEKEAGLTDRAYFFIKEAIVDYRLKPGAALGLRTLAAALEMSQTPVREALLRLEQEQFIERRGNKGFVVASFTLDQVMELYDLRLVLELAGVRWAAQRFTAELGKELDQILEQTESLLEHGTRLDILSQEYRFHSLVIEAGGNKPLRRMAQVVLDRVRLIQNLSSLTKDRLDRAHRQHREIFEALAAKNPRRAEELMESHLREARGYLLSRLENEDDILSLLLSGLPEAGLKSAPG